MKPVNVLLSAVGRRAYLVEYFKDAVRGGGGKVYVVNCLPDATGLLAADAFEIVPPSAEPGYVEKMLELCHRWNVTLLFSLLVYCIISTGAGLLASSVTRSQIAVIFLTMLGTMLPAVQLCGLTNPVETQSGAAYLIGEIYPTSHMLLISRGVFNKALHFKDLYHEILILLVSVPVVLGLGVLFLKKQES